MRKKNLISEIDSKDFIKRQTTNQNIYESNLQPQCLKLKYLKFRSQSRCILICEFSEN